VIGLRRALGVLLVVVAVLALAAGAAGKTKPPDPPPGTTVRAGGLAIPVPRSFHRYDVRGGIYRTGTRPPVVGATVTDYRVEAGARFRTRGVFPLSAPGNGVAFEVALWAGFGALVERLHLPLSLDEPWMRRPVAAGTRRYGFLRLQGHDYEVFVWTGRNAPPQDVASLLQALAAIRSAR
jgi:hypothetical protein